MLIEDDRIRYWRQILFLIFGDEGQKKLTGFHIVVAGIGGWVL